MVVYVYGIDTYTYIWTRSNISWFSFRKILQKLSIWNYMQNFYSQKIHVETKLCLHFVWFKFNSIIVLVMPLSHKDLKYVHEGDIPQFLQPCGFCWNPEQCMVTVEAGIVSCYHIYNRVKLDRAGQEWTHINSFFPQILKAKTKQNTH